MSDAKSPAACAEFPNDNRALHRGAIWTCADTCEPATVERPADWQPLPSSGLIEEAGEFAGDEEAWPDDIEIVDELFFEGAIFEDVPALAAASTPSQPAPTAVPAMAEEPAPTGNAPSPIDPYALLVDRIADVARTAGGEATARTVRELLGSTETTWRAILRGESEDFSACGSTTLDEWSANLVARVLGQPARATVLRQDLRRRGVAAFGLLDDAV